MNLYLVTCVCDSRYSGGTVDVYVAAVDPGAAQRAALQLMQRLEWKFDDRVDNIQLLASVNTHRADKMLVIADEYISE